MLVFVLYICLSGRPGHDIYVLREERLHVCVGQRGAAAAGGGGQWSELCRKGHASRRKMFPEIEIFRNLAAWEIVRTYSVIR